MNIKKPVAVAATVATCALATACIFTQNIQLTVADRYDSGLGEGAAEVVSFDAQTKRLFVVNAETASIDVLSVSAQNKLSKVGEITLGAYQVSEQSGVELSANSVAAKNGKVAVALEEQLDGGVQLPGSVVVFDAQTLSLQGQYTAGYLPDMVTFTHDGESILVANEGEPSDAYDFDPEGSITRIDLGTEEVTQISFTAFNQGGKYANRIDRSVRIFGQVNRTEGSETVVVNSTVAQDLEPEYITVSQDNKVAWVSLQENNAIALLDLKHNKVKYVHGLGYKDYSLEENAMDASNKDDAINIIPQERVLGMYQPDAIDSFRAIDGKHYIVTANEGDARDYDGFSEEVRVDDLVLDESFPEGTQLDENLGRLKTTTTQGDTDGDGDVDVIYSYGARSFSIFDSYGKLVFDSGNDFIKKVIEEVGEEAFLDGKQLEGRSDDKGVEPEGVVVGKIENNHYAFIGLERAGGIMVYDITLPQFAKFVQYIRTEDVSPEGLTFIPAQDSPSGKPALAASHEVSGTTVLFDITINQ